MNEYYILSKGQLNLLENSGIVESLSTVEYSLNGNKFVCKTRVGITGAAFMNPNTKYTHEEIKLEMAKAEWTTPDVI